jgi:hypothetical protein
MHLVCKFICIVLFYCIIAEVSHGNTAPKEKHVEIAKIGEGIKIKALKHCCLIDAHIYNKV